MSTVVSKGKAKTLEKDKVPPPLTFEEAQLAWKMQLATAFHDSGLEKYTVTEKVDGGTIRPAIPIEGALCDYPDCPNEYKYALELDGLAGEAATGLAGSTPIREGFYGVAGIGGAEVYAGPADKVLGAPSIFVCEDHKNYRPDKVGPQRFNEKYNPARYADNETHQVSKIRSFTVIEKDAR